MFDHFLVRLHVGSENSLLSRNLHKLVYLYEPRSVNIQRPPDFVDTEVSFHVILQNFLLFWKFESVQDVIEAVFFSKLDVILIHFNHSFRLKLTSPAESQKRRVCDPGITFALFILLYPLFQLI